MTYSISVIICAYTEKRWNDLVTAVMAVVEQTHEPLEVIVVIDHNFTLFERALERFAMQLGMFAFEMTTPSDMTMQLPSPFGARVHVIENTEQQGLSGARNSGMAVAQGDIVAFMDEDAIPDTDWLAQLVAGYDDPLVLGVGGAIEPLWLSERPRWFPPEFDWVVGCTYLGMPLTTAPVRNLIGCNMSFRRDVVNTLGGFRDGIGRIGTLPVGCEETDYCIRIHQAFPDATLRYEPRAKVSHRVPASRANWDYFRSRCYFEGRSKAIITQWSGSQDGLSSERTYTLKTLPKGVLRGLGDTFLRGDTAGFGRSAAIIAGLLITTWGYLVGKLK